MIQINCTNCKALLQIDDAFAGGVCRCRHCGTIQTVPKHLKDSNGDDSGVTAAAAIGASGKAPKTLYQKKRSAVTDPGGAGSGTGLDDLAGIVASSGLTSGRLQKKPGSVTTVLAPLKDRKTMIIIASAGGVIALLLGIIIVMAVRDRSGGGGGDAGVPDNTAVANGGSGGGTGQTSLNAGGNGENVIKPPDKSVPKVDAPSFLTQPLNERSVVYVVDRGAASQTDGRLDLAKQALLRSVRSLGPTRKFAVVFWYVEGNKPMSWPATGLSVATPEAVAELQKFLDDIYGVGQTRMAASMEKAFKSGAEAIVLVPIKTFLDDGFPPSALKARGKSTAKVYCVTLGQPDLAPQLKKIANDTKGGYRDVSLADVRAAAGQ
jgi:hypothetical protein